VTDAALRLVPPPSDAELIERVVAGERDLYRTIVQRYQRSLFRVAYAMVLDRDAAEDLVQDAFVRAYVNLSRCENRERFQYWLMSTLRNRALDFMKERRRQDISLSDDRVLQRLELSQAHADLVEIIDLKSALDRVLERLTAPLREAFVLRYVEEYSIEELADVLGVTVSAVKMRLSRAREQLAEWLREPAPSRPAQRVTESGRRSS
jgi:RNA polymerase sigma-70 factor (ECF subfamily)